MRATVAPPLRRPAARVEPAAVLALVAVAQFMVILDATVVNVALPTIKREEHGPRRSAPAPAGSMRLPDWFAVLVRLARVPVVSIASIRGRAHGAGSEFVLSCDLRFASRENTLLGQFEAGTGLVPQASALARLSRSVGPARALEILLAGDDLDGPRAEQYGYVNRVISDDELDAEVDQIAGRLARFDHDAIARTKAYIDQVTMPAV